MIIVLGFLFLYMLSPNKDHLSTPKPNAGKNLFIEIMKIKLHQNTNNLKNERNENKN
jgi:hypothetical protein